MIYDWMLPVGDANEMFEPYKCTCGCHVTFGKDCPREYHQDYCDLYIEKKHLEIKNEKEN